MKKNKALIAFVIGLILLIGFIFSLGNSNNDKKLEKETDKYDDIDFNKACENIDEEINIRKKKLNFFIAHKEEIEKSINKAIYLIKVSVVFMAILYNLSIYLIYKLLEYEYGIGVALNWNELLLIISLFVLFLISEKHSGLYQAFGSLKEKITRKTYNKWKIHLGNINKLENDIKILEYVKSQYSGMFS